MSKVKKNELGKGLAALLGNIEAEVNQRPQEVVKELAGSVAMIAVDTIEVNPNQPRVEFDLAALEELAASIKELGLIQPVTLRRLHQDAYQLISGERRLRASKLAGLTEIPAYIRIANDQEMMEMALVENIQREDLNPIEIAIAYQRLIDECKLTHENLSDRVGKSRSAVSNYLRLLRLSPDVQKALKEKKLSMGHAKVLAGVEDPALVPALLKPILEDQISVRRLEELIESYTRPQPEKAAPTPASTGMHREIQDTISAFFGSKVSLQRSPEGKGKITIHFHSDDDLNRILDQIEEKSA